jgi:hypothetical protein
MFRLWRGNSYQTWARRRFVHRNDAYVDLTLRIRHMLPSGSQIPLLFGHSYGTFESQGRFSVLSVKI